MGGAVSSGESNDDLIDNLLEADYIKTPLVERVFRAVDRAFYYTEPYKQNAYKDLAWKDGNLHLSAPCIYSEVLENLDLEPGMCFLNVGSGTGYFSTMCGLILGRSGVNHGIELYSDVVNYARMKLVEFQLTSPAVDEFDFCPPEFTVGNCLDAIPTSKRYDRIYCGAAASNEYVACLVEMLKIGGICVVPVGDSLVQITRLEDKRDDRKVLLPVSFANLINPKENTPRVSVEMPEWAPKKLTELCRSEIRTSIRQTINFPEPKSPAEDSRKKKRKRRQERRRASRLVVVQRHHRSEMDGENGFVAIAYSVGSNSSDEDRNLEVEVGDCEQNVDTNGVESNASPASPLNEVGDDESNQVNNGDIIMEAEENPAVDSVADVDSNEPKTESEEPSSTSPVENNITSASSGNGVAVVTGTCPLYSASNGTRKTTDDKVDRRRPERRSGSASTSARIRSAQSAPRSARATRNYRTGAESLLGRIRELVRARQQDLETMRRQFQQRNGSDADHSRSRSTSGREDSNTDEGDDNVESSPDRQDDDDDGDNAELESLDTTSSESSPSPCVSATSSSSDDEIGAGCDSTTKRSRKDMEDKSTADEPKPDPLLINQCSVQMRKKILALPLPPALKVYVNYDRKLYYY